MVHGRRQKVVLVFVFCAVIVVLEGLFLFKGDISSFCISDKACSSDHSASCFSYFNTEKVNFGAGIWHPGYCVSNANRFGM
jgi:hypothetical protein